MEEVQGSGVAELIVHVNGRRLHEALLALPGGGLVVGYLRTDGVIQGRENIRQLVASAEDGRADRNGEITARSQRAASRTVSSGRSAPDERAGDITRAARQGAER